MKLRSSIVLQSICWIVCGWVLFAIGHSFVILLHSLYASDVVMSRSIWMVADLLIVVLGVMLVGIGSIKIAASRVSIVARAIVASLIIGVQIAAGYVVYVVLVFWVSSDIVPLFGGRGGF